MNAAEARRCPKCGSTERFPGTLSCYTTVWHRCRKCHAVYTFDEAAEAERLALVDERGSQ